MRHSSLESEDSIWDWSELDGEPSASPKSTRMPQPSSPSDGLESRTSVISPRLPIAFPVTYSGHDDLRDDGLVGVLRTENDMAVAIPGSTPPSGPAASPAKTSPLPASGQGSVKSVHQG